MVKISSQLAGSHLSGSSRGVHDLAAEVLKTAFDLHRQVVRDTGTEPVRTSGRQICDLGALVVAWTRADLAGWAGPIRISTTKLER
jgi:hypothetical protein